MNKLQKRNDDIFELIRDDGEYVHHLCLGVNWDSINKHGLFADRKIKADIDISCIIFDENEHILDVVYYYQMKSKDGSIIHTGDDRYAHMDSDNVDNEVIRVNLDTISKKAKRLVFVLNAYDKAEFAQIPHMKVRVYEGKPNKPEEILATADIINDNLFSGYLGMLIAEIYKHHDNWIFSAIFELTEDLDLEDTIRKLKKRLIN